MARWSVRAVAWEADQMEALRVLLDGGWEPFAVSTLGATSPLLWIRRDDAPPSPQPARGAPATPWGYEPHPDSPTSDYRD